MAHRVAKEVDFELDDIWLYTAKQSGSVEIADKVVDSIMGCFATLGRNPYMGRGHDLSCYAGFADHYTPMEYS